MIRVYLTRNGAYWLARWKGGGKSLGNRANISEADARLACARLQQELEAGRQSVESPTLGQWIESFLALKPDLAEGSVGLYQACGQRLSRFLGGANIALKDVTPLQGQQFMAWLTAEEGLAAGSVARIIREAKAIFQAAEDAEVITKNPLRRVRGPTARPDRRWWYLDLPTLDRLLEASPGPWRAFLGLVRLSGLRQGEALRLTWQDVDLIRKRLIVVHPGRYETTKARTREIPIVPRLAEVLFEVSMATTGGQRVCEGIRRGSIWRGFQALCARAKIAPWERWCHTMRKNRETDWAGQHPIHVVAAWLGNSPTVALDRYLAPKDGDFDRAASPAPASASDLPTPLTRSSGPPQAGF